MPDDPIRYFDPNEVTARERYELEQAGWRPQESVPRYLEPEPPEPPEPLADDIGFTEMEYPESPLTESPWSSMLRSRYQEFYGIAPDESLIQRWSDRLTSGVSTWQDVAEEAFSGLTPVESSDRLIVRTADGAQAQFNIEGDLMPSDPDALAYMRNYLDVWWEYNRNTIVEDGEARNLSGLTPDQFARWHYQTYGNSENRFWGLEPEIEEGPDWIPTEDAYEFDTYAHDSRVPTSTFTPIDLRTMDPLDSFIVDPEAHLRKSAKETFKRNLEPVRI